MTLTVCIPFHTRDATHARLLQAKIEAYSKDSDITLLLLPNNGEYTIGEFRHRMIMKVQTKYLVFIDADDLITPDYFRLVDEGMKLDVDAIGFKGIITTNGRMPFEFIHSSRYKKWEEVKDRGSKKYLRPINHLNPIKTEIAQKIGYKALKHAEDLDYSMRLSESGLIKSEHFIDKVIYHYLYRSKK
jgi:glycosyltransferase involved in cell wall biosynthesis